MIVLFVSIPTSAKGIDECGRAFQEIPRPFAFGKYYGGPSGNLWAAGGYGTVSLTRPNRTVLTVELGTSASFNSILFAKDETVGYVVGTSGAIFSSVDLGQTWIRRNSGRNEELEAIDCTDKSTCWAVGRNGTVLSTINGGLDWDFFQIEDKPDLRSVSFANSKVGWIAGNKWTVLKTHDGGRTWEGIPHSRLRGSSKTDIRAIAFTTIKFFSDDLGCVAGDSRIICTSDGGETWSFTETDKSLYANKWLGFAADQAKLIAVGECAENDFVSFDRGKSWVRRSMNGPFGRAVSDTRLPAEVSGPTR